MPLVTFQEIHDRYADIAQRLALVRDRAQSYEDYRSDRDVRIRTEDDLTEILDGDAKQLFDDIVETIAAGQSGTPAMVAPQAMTPPATKSEPPRSETAPPPVKPPVQPSPRNDPVGAGRK
jgi:hypothetical protein